MSQFVAYHADLDGTQSIKVPIAVGTTEEECRLSALEHVARIGCREGVLIVEARDDIPPAAFEKLKGFIDTFFLPVAGSA